METEAAPLRILTILDCSDGRQPTLRSNLHFRRRPSNIGRRSSTKRDAVWNGRANVRSHLSAMATIVGGRSGDGRRMRSSEVNWTVVAFSVEAASVITVRMRLRVLRSASFARLALGSLGHEELKRHLCTQACLQRSCQMTEGPQQPNGRYLFLLAPRVGYIQSLTLAMPRRSRLLRNSHLRRIRGFAAGSQPWHLRDRLCVN